MSSEAMDTVIGKVVTSVEGGNIGDEEMVLQFEDGSGLRFYHEQNCCESVAINEVHGDLADLIGAPILAAECSTNEDDPPEYPDSWLWTFYRFTTIRGSVVVRWLGESNGYYSESVDCEEIGVDGTIKRHWW